MNEMPSFDLDGQVAVVTGSSRGLGKWIALGLAQAGADVLVTYCGSRHDGEDTRAQITALGRRAHLVQVDVGDVDSIQAMVHTAVDELGGLDIMVNNAGINVRTPALEMTPEDFDAVVRINQRGVYFGCQAAARVMVERGGGRIINMALAAEWAPYGINVNAVAPGYFATPLTAAPLADPKLYKRIIEFTPLSRVGEAKDIMGAVVFLASEAANFITGQTLSIDGGRTVL